METATAPKSKRAAQRRAPKPARKRSEVLADLEQVRRDLNAYYGVMERRVALVVEARSLPVAIEWKVIAEALEISTQGAAQIIARRS